MKNRKRFFLRKDGTQHCFITHDETLAVVYMVKLRLYIFINNTLDLKVNKTFSIYIYIGVYICV